MLCFHKESFFKLIRDPVVNNLSALSQKCLFFQHTPPLQVAQIRVPKPISLGMGVPCVGKVKNH